MNCLYSSRLKASISLLAIASVSSVAFAGQKKCLDQKSLGEILKSAVQGAQFENVTDLGPNFTEDPCPATEPA